MSGQPAQARGRDPVDTVQALLDGSERFAVTGASGWFGRGALDLLRRALGERRFREHVRAYAGAAKPVEVGDGAVVRAEPLEALADHADEVTHLLHFAYLTRDRVADLGVDAFIAVNLDITDTVLGLVAQGRLRGLAYTSSGASLRPAGSPSWGAVRDNPYRVLKHLDELVLRQACADADASSCVARVFATSGPFMARPELYVLGDFVSRALRNEDLEVRAARRVVRSYTSVEDIVGLQLAAVLRPGRHDEVFETGGEEVEVEELAHRVVRALGRNLPIVRTVEPTGPEDRYVGDPGAMEALAGRLGMRLATLDDQILSTASWLGRSLPAQP